MSRPGMTVWWFESPFAAPFVVLVVLRTEKAGEEVRCVVSRDRPALVVW